MPAVLLCAHFTDQELTQRKQARTGARRTLPDPAVASRALALAICEVEAGLRAVAVIRCTATRGAAFKAKNLRRDARLGVGFCVCRCRLDPAAVNQHGTWLGAAEGDASSWPSW
jgi:hypothetical protein